MMNFGICIRSRFLLAVVELLLLCPHISRAFQVSSLYSQQSGKGTFYTSGTGDAECSFNYGYPAARTNSMINFTVAINSADYAGSLSCGACIQGTGSGGTGPYYVKGNFFAFVDDECPTCDSGGLDVFVSKNEGGVTPIVWKLVDCPVGSTKIQYTFVGGSTVYYIKLQVLNHRVPVAGMNIYNTKSKSYAAMVKTSDNFFQLPDGFPQLTLPLQIQVVSVSGETLDDEISSITNDVIFDSPNQIQFSPYAPIDDTNPQLPPSVATTASHGNSHGNSPATTSIASHGNSNGNSPVSPSATTSIASHNGNPPSSHSSTTSHGGNHVTTSTASHGNSPGNSSVSTSASISPNSTSIESFNSTFIEIASSSSKLGCSLLVLLLAALHVM